MQPVKDPVLVKKYRRMIRIWEQRYGGGEKLDLDLAVYSPRADHPTYDEPLR